MLLSLIAVVVPLLVTYWVYDRSSLYTLQWLPSGTDHSPDRIVNIHAGFDETTALLQKRYPRANVTTFDFYDEQKHTEVSIRRARRAYPNPAGTVRVKSTRLPAPDASTDLICNILATHEIRDDAERIRHLAEQKRLLAPGGKAIVVEHLRDLANFAAYNFGFLHFHSRNTWLQAFRKAGLNLEEERKLTPFLTIFILTADGITP